MNRLVAALAALVSSCALAGPIQLVKDINHTVTVNGTAGKPVAFGSKWLATLCGTTDGAPYYSPSWTCAPFVTDGTADGTVALNGVQRNSGDQIGPYAVMGGAGYFLDLNASMQVTTLWKTDGTPAGTASVATTTPGSYYYSLPSPVIAATSTVVFFATPARELWRSDGTPGGTFRLATGVTSFAVLGERAYFGALDAATGTELYVTDGTTAGTTLLKDINPGASSSTPTGLAAIGGKVFFWATDSDFGPTMLWATDGTTAGTQQVLDIAPTTRGAFIDFGGKAYFLATGNTNIAGLWSSDGTTAGTVLVDAWTNTLNDVTNAAVSGGYLYFNESGGVYRTDGTVAGTVAITGGPTYGATSFVGAGTDVYFRGTDSSGASALWKVAAGTTAATKVQALNAAPWAAMGNRVIVATNAGTLALLYDATNGMQPMQTANGQLSNASHCSQLSAVLGNRAFFPANDGVHGCQLWSTDGTDAGTTIVKDFSDGIERHTLFQSIVGTQGFVYFIADTPLNNYELWRTDGTAGGTSLVQSLGYYYSSTAIGAAGSSLVFAYNSDIYRVDAASPAPVKVVSSTSYPNLQGPYPVSDGFFFISSGPTYPSTPHLYKYNLAGGTIVDTGTNAPTSYYGTSPLALGNMLLWAVQAGSTGGAIWRSDGTSAGTVPLVSLSAYYPSLAAVGVGGGRAYFLLNGTLYRTDGSTAGTVAIPGISGSFNSSSVGGSGLWFTTYSNGLGHVGSADTAASTVVGSGVSSYYNAFLFATSSGALFSRTMTDTGSEMWLSTGTPAGTVLLQDLEPGTASAVFSTAPPQAVELPTGVLFFANHAALGMEPYFVANDTSPDAISFPSQAGVALNSTITSVPEVVQGLTQAAPVSAMNGQFCVSSTSSCACDVQPFATTGSVSLGQYLCARHTSALTPGTSTTTLLNIGGVTASFTSTTMPGRNLTVALAGTGSGSVVSNPTGISCASDCFEIYVQGTAVRLIAFANPGSRFSGWSGGCSGTGDCVLNLAADTAVTATFDTASLQPASNDLSGDGRSDLVWTGAGGSFGAWIMNGTSSTSYATLSGGAGFTLVQVGDFDGDGRKDLLWRGTDGSYKVQLMNGTTVVGENVILNGGTGWEVVGKGDFNGDGKTDLLWKAANGTYGLWLMNGLTFSSAGLFQAPGIGWDVVIVADFNGDGNTDILWRNTDGRVDMWLMDGFLSSAQTSMIGSATGWLPTHAADFNADGKTDLLWRNSDGSLGLWLVNGTSITQYTQLLGANSGWTVSAVGDLDGDGKADVILTHTNGSVGAWLMNGAAIASYGSLRGPGTGWSVAAMGDFNGDGRADIVWKHTDGSVALWLMDGLTPYSTSTILGPSSGWSVMP